MRQIEKIVMLQTLDSLWKDHLLAMDHLKEGIGLRGYAQLNPLVEYQKEGFSMFEALMATMQLDVVEKVFSVQTVREQERAAARAAAAPAASRDEPWRRDRAGAGGRSTGGGSKARGRQGRPQRSMSVRLGQEVQALPRQVVLIALLRTGSLGLPTRSLRMSINKNRFASDRFTSATFVPG